MPQPITRKIASRAIDAWFRRLLVAAAPRQRGGVQLPTGSREVFRAKRDAREALVDAVVDAELSDALCADARRGREILARRLRDRSATVAPSIERLETAVAGDPDSERRYKHVIRAARGLLEPESPSPGCLLREICLVASLSRQHSIPWARRL
jgi:hypothetical protein